jgi:hypothetical protein
MDARVDITDIFAFQNPADPTRSVLVMNVNPVAPTLEDSFAPEAVYELILDTDSDAVADITYRVTFSPRENDDQRATVRRATGEEVRTAEISGEVLFRNVPVSFDGDAGVVESGDYEFFVGIRSDPFFFDLEGFQHDFEFTGDDFFIDKNVFSMVLEMPNTASWSRRRGHRPPCLTTQYRLEVRPERPRRPATPEAPARGARD